MSFSSTPIFSQSFVFHCVLLSIFCLIFSSSLQVVAQTNRVLPQEDVKVSLQLNQVSFDQFIEQLESQVRYLFFYDRTLTDSIQVSIRTTETSLSRVLDQVLTPHGLYISVLPDNRIFITPETALTLNFDGIINQNIPYLLDSQRDTVEAIVSIENRIFEFGDKDHPNPSSVLTGHVRDASSGNPIPMAKIAIEGSSQSVLTDQHGYFSIPILNERSTVLISSVGKKETQRQLLMYDNGRLDIYLDNQVYSLDEVVVAGSGNANVTRTQMGVERLTLATIKQTPTVFGEADLVGVVLTLPGIQTVGEAAAGFNVRGGATDQNLVLFNDATIYNPSHFFGFFSAFNPDAISNVELYKSSMPARFGGRLSSVLDVSAKEGNRNEFSGSGGIGLLTGRVTLEGPIGPKTSFLLGGRSTYSDWLLRLIPDESYNNSSASFYDANIQLSHHFDTENSLYFMGYLSNDFFGLTRDTTYAYQNQSVNMKWKHVYHSSLYSNVTLGYDGYEFGMGNTFRAETAYDLKYQIQQLFAKMDFHQTLSERHRLQYGLSAIRYGIQPGSFSPRGALSQIVEVVMNSETAMESALHISDVIQVTDDFTLDLGLRYSLFQNQGEYAQVYQTPEWRFSALYRISPVSSLKASYNSLAQYIHMLSNTTSITPTDTWKLSSRNIRPQRGDQAALGFYQNFNNDRIETSVEVYYKRMRDYLDYKGGATLLMNPDIHLDVIGTEARAYGVELLIKKLSGRLNGWISYTYSKVEQRTVDVPASEMINAGEYYPSNHDKPHNVTLVGNYKFSHRLSFSLNGTYSTGRPITMPIGQYEYLGTTRLYYSQRNQYRIPDFFRLDASFNIEGNHKIHKLAHSSWTVGVYNLTGRKNPFSVYYLSEPEGIKGYKLSIFGSQIPFITYNFKF